MLLELLSESIRRRYEMLHSWREKNLVDTHVIEVALCITGTADGWIECIINERGRREYFQVEGSCLGLYWRYTNHHSHDLHAGSSWPFNSIPKVNALSLCQRDSKTAQTGINRLLVSVITGWDTYLHVKPELIHRCWLSLCTKWL